jgi:muramoyltetrapeptide carboxypeptidase
MVQIPPYLKKGDRIGIVCPAGYLPKKNAAVCVATLQEWGYQVELGKTLGSQFHYFSGTDTARLEDLQSMLDDANIHAILCGRGGYGLSRIIDQLNFTKFKKNPKWLIGFSDITVLHSHLYQQIKFASLHAPMAAAFNNNGANNVYVQSLKKALSGKLTNINCAPHAFNQFGKATGVLMGGNLSLIAHLIGSKSALKTD